MSDLIRRKDAIEVVYELVPIRNDAVEIADAIRAIPSAERKGEWLIEKTLYDNYNYRCSYCDWYETHAYPDVEPYNYCPNCGADMRGEDDGR